MDVLLPLPKQRSAYVEVADGQRVHIRDGRADMAISTMEAQPPVLFVHGQFGSSRNWTGLTSLLSGRLGCVAIDLPGFGGTPPPACYSTATMADTVAAVAAAVSAEPVHLVGNSYGGTIALWLAAHHPALVRTLTLISPAVSLAPGGVGARQGLEMLYRLCAGEAALRRLMTGKDAAAVADTVLRKCCTDRENIDPAVFDGAAADAHEALRRPWRITAEARSFRALVATLARSYLPFGPSLRRMARQVRVPTALIWGERDMTVPLRHARRLAKLIPRARLTVVRGVGHLPHLEAPQRVADIIERHVAWV